MTTFDNSLIYEQMDICIYKAAKGYNPHKEGAATFSTYYQSVLRNALNDLCRNLKRVSSEKINDYEVFEAEAARVNNLLDHDKILLLRKKKKHVYFTKKDLNVLDKREKDLLAVISQVWVTNKVIAKYFNCSPSTIGRIWSRINRKLKPIYEKNFKEQNPFIDAANIIDQDGAVKKGNHTYDLYNTNMGGWSIEKAYFSGHDDHDDFNHQDDIHNF